MPLPNDGATGRWDQEGCGHSGPVPLTMEEGPRRDAGSGPVPWISLPSGMNLPLQQTRIGCSLRGASHLDLPVAAGCIGVEVMRARFPPGSRILRLPRFGRGWPVLEVTRAVRGLRELAERPEVVRAHIEIWSEREAERLVVARACEAEGFRRIQPRMYPRTLWIDIGAEEDEILASFHPTARRHIRAPAKKGFQTVALSDPRHASRLEELHQASFLRSGGEAPFADWSATLA